MIFSKQRAWLAVVSVALMISAFVLGRAALQGQTDRWYPSRWGANDQRGAANRITPAKILEAKNLITRGTIYQLGRVYEAGMPMFGTRHYSLRIPQAFKISGTNQPIYHDELVSGELGQIGTQFDGLGHFGIGDLFYNGNNRADFAQPEGLNEARYRKRWAIVHSGRAYRCRALQGRGAAPAEL
jgi:hypothetical protein